jgi:hypothetical protein
MPAFAYDAVPGSPAYMSPEQARGQAVYKLSTPGQNLTLPPVENLTDRRGDEPQAVATS